ncbi:kinase-like domain-containing protein [Entophlyctis helioformis]|nr:kinase-like domain-containing protein [Entophlyctis helioformis]
MSAPLDSKIQDVNEKLKKERMVLDGATRMLAVQTQPSARQMVQISVVEAQRRIEFLEGELRKLQLKRSPGDASDAASLASGIGGKGHDGSSSGRTSVFTASEVRGVPVGTAPANSTVAGITVLGGSASSSMSSLGGPDEASSTTAETHFDYVRFGTAITADKVKFRLKQIQAKLDIEQKVRTGTENMVSALGAAMEVDPRRKAELDQQLAEAKGKESLLIKAKNKFTQLYVAEDEQEDSAHIVDNALRKTGRLSMKIVGAANLTGRKSIKEEIVAEIYVDGIKKYTSRPTRQKWDEVADLTLDKALEIEINVRERGGPMLGICWFKINDLEEHLVKTYGAGRAAGIDGVQETWLEMEPNGQMLIKLNFAAVQRSKTERDRIFRRNPVQKVYPRNGHRFLAQQFYQVMQCALCNEFLGRQGYQCQACRYTVHAKCYHRVITKCIPPDEYEATEDKNTGQLLKYKIPHRWENVTNLGAAWCSHCGYLLPPGRKIHRCSECSRSSHKECSAFVPHFCGLAPDMADMLMAAFEEHEKKMIQRDLEEADKARKAAPAFDPADVAAATGDAVDFSPDKVSPDDSALPADTPAPQRLNSIMSPAQMTVKPTQVSQVKTPPKDVTIDDFHFVAVLGRGAFGKVMLANEKLTGHLYAIKALKKEFIIQNDDVKSTKLEKSIFQAASAEHHPFMVNLHSSFQTESRVYFVMEYVPGGDLMCHIQDKKRFSQARTRFYACEVLLALQYFHQNNIVYRDLKLDNILLGGDGHIKVADYGICKANMPYGATTSTFCGTPDYMAPEILMNRRYGLAVDWWSFGVLIFVMLVGRYPFHGEDENDILEAILADAIDYPTNMPRITLSLLQSLMNKVPSRRLGGGSADAEEVKRHPYFANVDWDAVLRKEHAPPFVPTINDPYDVSNFDKEFTAEQPVLTPITSQLGDAEQREFSDFQYIADWAYQTRIAAACAGH